VIEFRYRAVTASGELVVADAHAPDEQALAQRLASRGETLLEAQVPRARGVRRLSPAQRLLWYQEMDVLLEAGLPLHDALSHNAKGDTAMARCSRQLADALGAGHPLSAAVANQPKTFSPLACAFVRAGETTGDLAQSIRQLAELENGRLQLRQKVRRAVAYPLATLCVLAVVVPAILVFLVPQLLSLISVLGSTLPWYTHALITLSGWVVDFGAFVALFGCGAAAVGWWLCGAGRPLETVWARLMLRIPLVGPLTHQAQLSVCCRQVAELYGAGLPLDSALALASESASNLILDRAFSAAATTVRSGRPVHEALGEHAVFPALMVQLARTGEHSGCLDKTLRQVSDVFGRMADRKAEQLAAAVGPVLLLVVAGLIGWVVAAVLLPLYESLFTMGELL